MPSPRRPSVRPPAGVAAAVATALLVGACSVSTGSGGTSTPSPAPTPGEPVLTTPPPAPTSPEPSEPEPVGPEPLLRATYPDLGLSTFVTRFGPRTVVASDSIVGLDRRGEEVWDLPIPAGKRDDAEVARVGTVVTLAYPVRGQDWPGLRLLTVLDGRSGEVLWRDRTASFVSTTEEAVYTSVCTGEQDDNVGDCTLSARAPRTGEVLWSQPTYASSSVEDTEPGLLLVRSYPTGYPGVVQVHDAASGVPVSTTVDASGYVTLAGRSIVSSGPDDEDPSDGCRQAAFAVDFAGDRVWRRSLRIGRDTLEPDECFEMYVDAGDDGLASLTWYEGVPTVVDAATGETVWRGERGEDTPVVSRRTIVAVSGETTRVVTPHSGRVRWTAPGETGDRWIVDGDQVVAANFQCYDPCTTTVFETASGRRVAEYAGYYAAHGRGWLATTDEPTPDPVEYAVYDTSRRR